MKILNIILFLISVSSGYAQKLPEVNMTIRLTEPDRTIVAEVRPVNSDIKARADHQYYWYGSGKIQQTQGGYSGKPLNGTYNEYYPNKNLKTQGSFDGGSKTGVWKTWTENGILIAVTGYKSGKRSGSFSEYDETGKLVKEGSNKNDQLNGEVSFYQKDSVSVVTYKNGKALPPKLKTPLWKKIKLFKKSTAPPKP